MERDMVFTSQGRALSALEGQRELEGQEVLSYRAHMLLAPLSFIPMKIQRS